MSSKKSFKNVLQEATSKFITSPSEETLLDNNKEQKIVHLNDSSTKKIISTSKAKELNLLESEVENALNVDKKTADFEEKNINGKKLWKDKFRTTTVLEDEVKEYLDIIVRLDGCSVTTYINNLVRADMKSRADEYALISKMFNKNKHISS